MAKYARIENDTVSEIIETDGDISNMFHPSLKWIECAENIQAGDLFANGSFTPLPPPLPPPFAPQAKAYIATVRTTREMILNRLAGIAGRAYREGNIELADAADAASLALLDVTTAPAVLAATTLDELHDAVLDYYKGLVAGVPAGLKSAFDGMST